MFTQKYESYRYVNKDRVLLRLTQLIEKVLLSQERQLIYLYCGMENEEPMKFHELAEHFKLGSAELAEQRYNEAVNKTRAAIPGSELEYCIAGYIPKNV